MRLILGDCIPEMKKMADNSIDMIFTDPPYGHNNNEDDMSAHIDVILKRYKDYIPGTDDRPIANDGEEINEILRNMFIEANRILKPGAVLCCCCAGGGGSRPQFARWSLMLDEIIPFKMMVIWIRVQWGLAGIIIEVTRLF